MRQQLPDGCVRLRDIRLELADAIVQREPAFLDATKQIRGRKQLREAVDVKRRVGTRGDGTFDVLAAECLLPDDLVGSDHRHGQRRDPGLDTKRLDVITYELEQGRIGLGAQSRRHQERDADHGGEEDPSHRMR